MEITSMPTRHGALAVTRVERARTAAARAAVAYGAPALWNGRRPAGTAAAPRTTGVVVDDRAAVRTGAFGVRPCSSGTAPPEPRRVLTS